MRSYRIPAENGNGFYSFVVEDDFEYANPHVKMMEKIVGSTMQFHLNNIRINPITNFRFLADAAYKDQMMKEFNLDGFKELNRTMTEILAESLPNNFLQLLDSTKKAIHSKIVRSIILLEPNALEKFIMNAYDDYGYTYSMYRTDNLNGFDQSKMPRFAYMDGERGKIEKAGDTPFNNSQLSTAIEQQNVIIARFLDKGEQWHCFFYTIKGLVGKEPKHVGDPHIHYISHAWQIPRAEVLKQLRNKRYNLPSEIIRYNRTR